jgi:hypothetical protein
MPDRKSGHPLSEKKLSAALARKRFAVGALVNRRAGLVRADGDRVQRAVFCVIAVVCTLLNRAADCLVALRTIHEKDLLFDFDDSVSVRLENIH